MTRRKAEGASAISAKRSRASPDLDFASLVQAIREVHQRSAAAAGRAVNVALTLRNWVIGWYIREYEQKGRDRAAYGDSLLETLAERLKSGGLSDLSARTLRQCRQFYTVYPSIRQTPSADSLRNLLPAAIWQTVAAKSKASVAVVTPEKGALTRRSAPSELGAPVESLLNALSFSHFAELIGIDDPLKRAFYEIECARGNWSVRELRRQISTLYFERSGLSKDKKKLTQMVKARSETAEPKLTIRDPYIFEFLGLKAKDAVEESDLEAALVANLRDFLLELGNGFCLEAQQKSIIIGNTRGFVDLVFYHRILKCHVLVELKVDEFRHEHIGQLNTYITWYRKHMMAPGDNPPIGLLLCTRKDHALVEYALAGMDNKLFVSKYQRFLESRRRELLGGEPAEMEAQR
jgi:predicted nuclease of restriction endonuclease-like (RecB) superfamily